MRDLVVFIRGHGRRTDAAASVTGAAQVKRGQP